MTALTMNTDEIPTRKKVKKPSFWPVVFCWLLAVPLSFDFGQFRLSPYRILLLVLLLPCLIGWLSGKAGKKLTADYFMMLFVGWSVIAIFVTMGTDGGLQPAGMWVIETLGSYFLGRVFVRDAATFRRVVKALFLIILLLFPLIVAESKMNRDFSLDFFNIFGRTFAVTEMEFRAGLRRAQAVFEHPILLGVFCSSIFAPAFYVLGSAKFRFGNFLRLGISAGATFFSLSTGAFIAIAIQAILIAWDFAMRKSKRQWTILTTIVVFLYIAVDALSNRSPAEVFISYLTFNTGSSYNRVLIWKYGTEQVYMTPWFGTGVPGDWARPDWMHASLDNFWLLMAVRHGIPALLFLILAYFSILRRIGKAVLVDPQLLNARKGLLFSIIAISVSMCTVHLWSATYCLFMFLLGSGSWLIEAGVGKPPGGKNASLQDVDDNLVEETLSP